MRTCRQMRRIQKNALSASSTWQCPDYVSRKLPIYLQLQGLLLPRQQTSTPSPQWEPQISYNIHYWQRPVNIQRKIISYPHSLFSFFLSFIPFATLFPYLLSPWFLSNPFQLKKCWNISAILRSSPLSHFNLFVAHIINNSASFEMAATQYNKTLWCLTSLTYTFTPLRDQPNASKQANIKLGSKRHRWLETSRFVQKKTYQGG
jgi:hypothetical protein